MGPSLPNHDQLGTWRSAGWAVCGMGRVVGDSMALQQIRHRIAAAEAAAGRPAGSVQLIAVSKVQPEARVIEVLDQGHRLFGENYVQEASAK